MSTLLLYALMLEFKSFFLQQYVCVKDIDQNHDLHYNIFNDIIETDDGMT